MSGAPARRRRPEGSATREEILLCARELLAAAGPGAFSLREVARRVGVTPPALYSYFPDKDGLLAELAERILCELDHEVETLTAGLDPETALVEIAVTCMRRGRLRPAELRLMSELTAGSAWWQESPTALRFVARVKRLVAQASGRTDGEGEAIALLAMVHGLALRSAGPGAGPAGDDRELAGRAVATLIRGLRAA